MSDLAVFGGTPVIGDHLRRYVHPQLDESVFAQIEDAGFRAQVTSFDGLGMIARVETSFTEVFGVAPTLATNSGTSALFAMYQALGLGPGDDVLVPAYTFFATAMPLFRLGCRPVLVDSTDNGNIDPAEIRRRLTPRSKAIVITHMWGIPCDMAEISAVAAEAGIPVLEDASHAHGATFGGRVAGSFGLAAAWSLGARKLITGGQGGMFHSTDDELFERAFLVCRANDYEHDRRIARPEHQPYAVTGSGMNLRMHPFSAAVIHAQLRTFGTQLQQRREVADYLRHELDGVPGISLPRIPEDAEPAWYAFPMQYDATALHDVPRETFVRALAAEGATGADVPGSTCPLTEFRAFQAVAPAFPGAPVADQDGATFDVAYRFHRRLIKMPVWYGPSRMAQARAYAAAITKVAENAKQLVPAI